jgi:hypothetical protein
LHVGPSKRLWVGTVGGGVDCWNGNDGFEHYALSKLAQGLADHDSVFALHESADGRLWIGTRAGLLVLDPANRSISPIELADVPRGEHPLVTTIYADRNGRLWIGTLAHGVLILDPATGRSWRAHSAPIGESSDPEAAAALSIAATDNTIFIGSWGPVRPARRGPLRCAKSRENEICRPQLKFLTYAHFSYIIGSSHCFPALSLFTSFIRDRRRGGSGTSRPAACIYGNCPNEDSEKPVAIIAGIAGIRRALHAWAATDIWFADRATFLTCSAATMARRNSHGCRCDGA